MSGQCWAFLNKASFEQTFWNECSLSGGMMALASSETAASESCYSLATCLRSKGSRRHDSLLSFLPAINLNKPHGLCKWVLLPLPLKTLFELGCWQQCHPALFSAFPCHHVGHTQAWTTVSSCVGTSWTHLYRIHALSTCANPGRAHLCVTLIIQVHLFVCETPPCSFLKWNVSASEFPNTFLSHNFIKYLWSAWANCFLLCSIWQTWPQRLREVRLLAQCPTASECKIYGTFSFPLLLVNTDHSLFNVKT